MLALQPLIDALRDGRVRARELIEQCLQRIADPSGEGSAAFLHVFAAEARAHADSIDRLRAARASVPPFAGIPVSVKDLFDVAGLTTGAGSKALYTLPPAPRDAEVVERLRAAGMIVLGRTNMTEFAYSGLGVNPHFGTPRNPFDRATGRIPGGSSSGAAVSVTDEMAAAALGTDTGGSARIPAAMTGIVGFKPTAARVSRRGVLPLSTTLDSVGWLAPTVACCALLDAVLAGGPKSGELELPAPFPARGLRLLVPESYVLDDLDDHVAATFERSLAALSRAGAVLLPAPLPELERLPEIHAKGGFSAAESYTEYHDLIAAQGDLIDPRVAVRILKGREQTAADYVRLISARADLIEKVSRRSAAVDALVMPTVPIVAPALRELESDAAYFRANALALRNTMIANFLDRCAISIPAHRGGDAPVGLMLMGEHGLDRKLLAIARSVESLLSPAR
ncbi:MAG TPA: amidase [Steroidobacteraceae bacterium]|nr:amidase [Steroidobacteraceae bacterium]